MAKRKPDSLTLRFGPYPPPRTRRDARLFCQIRGTVTVGGYSNAPIPWPRVKKGGAHTLILCGSLLRAVKREPLIAVAHLWGVSQTTVWKWRKALAVKRWNEGSTDLIREWTKARDDDRLARARVNSRKPEAIAKISATLKGISPSPAAMAARTLAAKRPRSAEWCEKRSKLWKERGHRPPPPERPWTPEEDALLGTDEDAKVGAKIGRSKIAVWLRRKRLDLPGRRIEPDGNAIIKLRERKGWDRRALADRASVSIQALWMIETAKRKQVDRRTIERLATALGVDLKLIWAA